MSRRLNVAMLGYKFMGTFEATRFAAGRRNHNRIEVNGSKGSVVFSLEDMNRLDYYNAEEP